MSSVSTATSSTGNVGAITNQSQFNQSYTQFLNLLTTELQNQDPTSPMDATQFTNQLVGFSQLEQELNTNSNLQTLISNQQSQSLGSSLGYLGHTVIASGNSVQVEDGESTTIDYSLASSAASATVTVTNSSGQIVGSFAGPTAAGLNSISFDGTIPGGATLPPGDYTFSVTAASASGASVAATTYTSGTVTGIDTSNGTTLLLLGDLPVTAGNVVQVTQ
jgi:flagellar basal-body rod modification protein FlgD